MKHFLGIDVGGTNVKIAVVGTNGSVRARGMIDTDPGDGPRRAFVRIRAAAEVLLRGGAPEAVGVGCAGLVDPVRGRLFASPNLPAWENSPLRGIAERSFGVYTIVDNDANAAAYGEYRAGDRSRRRARNLVFITLGTGVGGGVVCDGHLLRGASNYAGELGHMAVTLDGPRCHCGSRGCLEAHVGTYGLIRSAREMLGEKHSRVLRRWVEDDGKKLTPRLIFDAARRRDAAAVAVVRLAGEHLGAGIASLINIFNPDRVVLGGGVSASFDLLEPHILRAVRRRAFSESARSARIEASRLGNDATAVGAALLAADAVHGNP